MAEEEHGLHEEPRPREHRKVSPVEREREWLAKQYSKEREAYWEKDTGVSDGARARSSARPTPVTGAVRRDAPDPEELNEQGEHPGISIVCLGCLIDDDPLLGRGLDRRASTASRTSTTTVSG